MLITNRLFWAITVLITIIGGQDIYDKTTQQCCDGIVHEKGRGLLCCGQELYNKLMKVCCVNQTLDFPSDIDDTFNCCFDDQDGQFTSYDPRTHKCCYGKLVPKPKTGIIYQCCGMQLYDYLTQTCCGEVIYESSLDTECCDNQMVNIDPLSACCGHQIIDIETQLCCHHYTENNLYTNTAKIIKQVRDKNSYDDECCSLETYNPKTEICCSHSYILPKPEGLTGNDYTRCCGKEVLVENTIKRRIGKRDCCSAKNPIESITFDSRTEQCCAGTVKTKDDVQNENKCCPSSREFYDDETEICTGAGVRPRSGDGSLALTEDYCMSKDITL